MSTLVISGADPDPRPGMEYGMPYDRTGPGTCSFCARTDGLVVTKHPWANRSAGQLLTRCPDHQRSYEAQGARA